MREIGKNRGEGNVASHVLGCEQGNGSGSIVKVDRVQGTGHVEPMALVSMQSS